MTKKQACIIGAGASGITAAKTLKENGISFDCFEKGSKVGGIWRFNNDNGVSAAYRSLHINTSRKIMSYSDFPMPDDYPTYPHHSDIIRYFEAYTQHFGIEEHIQFNTIVTDVSQNEDGTYSVTTDKGIIQNYDYVLVANGHHWNPRFPEPAFSGNFTGEVIHSHDYKEVTQVTNKDVLVVGMGNSAVDIACEAARTHTGKVTISTRSGAYIIPNWIWSVPFDSLVSPLTAMLPIFIQRIFLKLTLWLARGKQEDYGVPKPNRPLFSEHPTASQDLLNIAGRGLIKFKPNIKSFRDKTVIFEDGTEQDFDMIVYATGYKVTFPFLKKYKAFDVEETNHVDLYKRVVQPEYPNLFFLGLLQPLGAIMPLSEVQSKWISKLITGESKLPSKEAMQEEMEKDWQKMQKRYKHSPRHTLQVDFYPYINSIEKEIKRK